MYKKFKAALEDEHWFIALVFIMGAVLSFGLGRLSVTLHQAQSGSAPERVTLVAESLPPPNNLPEKNPEVIAELDQAVVASRNGNRYHLLTCPGAKQITETNKIVFVSPAAAAAAGYQPAANCPGL